MLDCSAVEERGGWRRGGGERGGRGGEMNSVHLLSPENKATGINWFNSSLFSQHCKPSLRNLECLSHPRAQGLSEGEVTHHFNKLQGRQYKRIPFFYEPQNV